ncbi:MAG: peptidyl-prolyl cis-trans isomerase A (cyclophilin A) [Halieaceae bacterium]|jgi:peptidyl-prolyl cis-trans isomerase A (cyclophilin A)
MQVLTVKTELGEFSITLESNKAPYTCEYFCALAVAHSLDNGTIFRINAPINHSDEDKHPISVVQVGLLEGLCANRTTIAHESTDVSGLLHRQWTVSAARFAPGEVYGSFFICMQEEPALNHEGPRADDGLGYAAFGRVTAGHDVLAKIYTQAQPQEVLDAPLTVQTVRLERSNEANKR